MWDDWSGCVEYIEDGVGNVVLRWYREDLKKNAAEIKNWICLACHLDIVCNQNEVEQSKIHDFDIHPIITKIYENNEKATTTWIQS